MASKKNTRVRFLNGYAAKADLLGVLAYPVALDEHEVEYTRFFMTNHQRWVQTPFELDLVSLSFGDGDHGPCWWLLGKRGQVIAFNSSATTQEQIGDAGTGPGKLGYVNSIRIIAGRMFVCGYRRQVYERVNGSWVHRDAGLVAGEDVIGVSLNDIDGNASGALCAVGNDGEIAFQAGAQWTLLDSPTNEHLHALCVDNKGKFCAAGANATVLRGDQSGFEVLCAGDPADVGTLWDIEWFDGRLVVAATAGLFAVRKGSLVPFDPPLPPQVVGYKLTARDGRLWSIGTHQVFCLDGKTWQEWLCPDNVP
jgi:hypothetical protein